MKAPEERFSGRVENYVRFRTGYPDALIDFLESECGLTADAFIADLGSGTGTLTRMLLDHGNTVFAIEPNAEMRFKAEQLLGHYERFKSVDATAESTTLPDECVDFVTAGRALQWFDAPVALREMGRILKPGGWALVVWNRRRNPPTALLAAYENMLRTYCRDYGALDKRRGAAIDLLHQSGFKLETLEHPKEFDLEQLKGLVLSLSVSPDQGDPSYQPMLSALEEIFEKYQSNGQVRFDYTTTIYFGRPQHSS